MSRAITRQGKCPRCNTEGELNYGVSDSVGANDLFYPVNCDDCGFVGKEWYNTIFTGFTDENNDDIE